jgi:DNA-binding beta-propeller fold protein YncE
LLRLDPASGAVRDRVILQGSATSLAAGFRSLWVVVSDAGGEGGHGRLVRVDERSGRVRATIDLATPARVATGAGAVWVTDPQRGELDRIDPAVDRVDGTVAVPRARAVAVARGKVWVADPAGGAVSSVDPVSLQVVTGLGGVGRPDELVASGTALWAVSTDAGMLTQIDTANPSLLPAVRLAGPVGAVAPSARGALWVTFDAGSRSGLGLIRAGQLPVIAPRNLRGIRAAALAATSDGLWTLEPRSSTLTLLEAR